MSKQLMSAHFYCQSYRLRTEWYSLSLSHTLCHNVIIIIIAYIYFNHLVFLHKMGMHFFLLPQGRRCVHHILLWADI